MTKKSTEMPNSNFLKSSETIWWQETLDANHFFNLPSVNPLTAAMLLCRLNPFETNEEVAALTTTDETTPKDFERLKQLFQAHYRTDSTSEKTLSEWINIADEAGYKYHSWIKIYSDQRVSKHESFIEIDHKQLAYKHHLIKAFGPFTGMNETWFKKLEGPLLRSKKVNGRGGRGCTIEPMFCPYEIVKWLTGTGFRKKNSRKISANKAWQLLKSNWPEVYEMHHLDSPLHDD
jgi:hypothetical protein